VLDGRVLPSRSAPPWTDDERDPADKHEDRARTPDGAGLVWPVPGPLFVRLSHHPATSMLK